MNKTSYVLTLFAVLLFSAPTGLEAQGAEPQEPALQEATEQADRGNQRRGLWGGFGFGGATLGCLESGCGDRIWGFSGNARLGGTVSPALRLAGGTNGYYKEEDGATLQGGVATFQALWYPGERDLFLIGGVGMAAFEAEAFGYSETETGAGFLFGVGWDASINRSGSLALTPYANWVVTTVGATIDFFQVGLGLTFN